MAPPAPPRTVLGARDGITDGAGAAQAAAAIRGGVVAEVASGGTGAVAGAVRAAVGRQRRRICRRASVYAALAAGRGARPDTRHVSLVAASEAVGDGRGVRRSDLGARASEASVVVVVAAVPVVEVARARASGRVLGRLPGRGRNVGRYAKNGRYVAGKGVRPSKVTGARKRAPSRPRKGEGVADATTVGPAIDGGAVDGRDQKRNGARA